MPSDTRTDRFNRFSFSFFFFSSRRRHTRFDCDWSSDVCSSDLPEIETGWGKRFLELLLRLGPVQLLERFSRIVLGRYLSKKRTDESELHMEDRKSVV